MAVGTVQIEESEKFSINDDTCHATAGTEKAHAHGLKVIPDYYMFVPLASGIVFESKAADATNIYSKSDTNSLAIRIIAFSRDLTTRD